MCGILGIRRSVFADPDAFRGAVAAMAWRGPDGCRELETAEWRLAVARLAISGVEDQPITTPAGDRVVLCNGAVTSAAAERVHFGDAVRTGNDAELFLHRLAADGLPGLVATRGHYAAAVVDTRADEVFLARDPEGEKPLHIVWRDGRVVAFASTLASLRALGLRVAWEPSSVARFFRFGFGARATLADGFELESDLRGALHDGPIGVERVAPVVCATDAPLAEALRASVQRCATAEVPVGLALSGGVDSACIGAALPVGMRREIAAYQFRAEGEPDVERANARRIAAHLGLTLRPIDAGPEILLALPELTRDAGMPLGDPSVLAVHALARRAAADGVRVLLGGEGADELFLGYRRHRLARWLPARRLLPSTWAPQAAMGTLARALRAVASEAPYDTLLEVAPPAFRAAVLVEAEDGALAGRTTGSSLARARRLDREVYLSQDLLPKLDTALMAAGIEGRCPYLDPAVTHCREAAWSDGRRLLGKRHLKEAFAAELPSGALAVRKRGFAVPLDRWLREDDWLADLLRDRRTQERPHLRAAGLQEMLDRHRDGRVAFGHALYLVAAMELHLRAVEEQASRQERQPA